MKKVPYPLPPTGFYGVFRTIEDGGKKEGRQGKALSLSERRDGSNRLGRRLKKAQRIGTILGRFGNILKEIKQEEEIYLL